MNTSAEQLTWVREFFEASIQMDPGPPGFYVSDTCVTSAVVVISAVVTAQRTPDFLASFTGLPLEFVQLVLKLMDRTDLWTNPIYKSLSDILDGARVNPLPSTYLTFWLTDYFVEDPEFLYYLDALDVLRAGFVFGGTKRSAYEFRDWRNHRLDVTVH